MALMLAMSLAKVQIGTQGSFVGIADDDKHILSMVGIGTVFVAAWRFVELHRLMPEATPGDRILEASQGGTGGWTIQESSGISKQAVAPGEVGGHRRGHNGSAGSFGTVGLILSHVRMRNEVRETGKNKLQNTVPRHW